MATRTAAKKAPAKAPAKKAASDSPRVIKSGGAKGAKVVDAIMNAGPNSTRQDIANDAGCTVGRVGEVVRWLAANGTAAEQEAVSKLATGRKPAAPKMTQGQAQKALAKKISPPRKAAAKKAPAKKAPAKVAPPKNTDDWDQF